MTKRIHIIGICGTFMGGLAKLAKELGYIVQGSDQNTYPPMSTQLESLGVQLFNGYHEQNLSTSKNIDVIVVGNTISRGNPELEYTLNHKLPYTSGAQWLAEHVLHNKWVLAVSGTHGKTTTSSLLAWILEKNGYSPGFLIGGVPENFRVSARLGGSHFFVIEADEYDTAFSDKRSKFIHYHPNTLVINNLEFDHADIFDSLDDIQNQFHHLIKTIPNKGQIIYNGQQAAIQTTLAKGCWSETKRFSFSEHQHDLIDFTVRKENASGSLFSLIHANKTYHVKWELIGEHNLNNAVAAIAAAHHAGVPLQQACQALDSFKSVKRRLELKGEVNQIYVYDDFAHHPTAIQSTLEGIRANLLLTSAEKKSAGEIKSRIIAIVEVRSNTMKMGVHKNALLEAVSSADYTYFSMPKNTSWATEQFNTERCELYFDTKKLIAAIIDFVQMGDNIVIMSNGGFDNIHTRILAKLAKK